MSVRAKRCVAAAMTVVIAAAVNVVTGMLTQHWSAAWWAAGVVLVVAGCGAQASLTLMEQSRGTSGVSASGVGAIAAARNVEGASTRVVLRQFRTGSGVPPGNGGPEISASGPGAIVSGKDARHVQTNVTEEGPSTA